MDARILIIMMISMPAKNLRKILKVGCSRAISLPPDWLRAMCLKKGEIVEVLYNSVVIVKPQGMEVDFDVLKREWEFVPKG